MSTLTGRTYLVTGGGTGIGHACAARLAADGASVTICGRTEHSLRRSAERANATARHGGSVDFIVADVTSESDVVRAVSAAVGHRGLLYGVVGSAGGPGRIAPYDQIDLEQFRSVLEVNVIGTMLCIKHSVGPMTQAGDASFVGLSSLAGGTTHPFLGAYPPAKAAIEAMIRNAADEYGPAGVRFNAVRPGFIPTEVTESLSRDSSGYRSIVANTPLNGEGTVADVADVVRFLAGPEARWITGETIAVDGGQHLRRGPDFSEAFRRKKASRGVVSSPDPAQEPTLQRP